jgi:hypothetical protein
LFYSRYIYAIIYAIQRNKPDIHHLSNTLFHSAQVHFSFIQILILAIENRKEFRSMEQEKVVVPALKYPAYFCLTTLLDTQEKKILLIVCSNSRKILHELKIYFVSVCLVIIAMHRCK